MTADLSGYPKGIGPLIADDAAKLAERVDRCKQLYLRPTKFIDWNDKSVIKLD